MIVPSRHIQDAGHGAHPGFENCDDPEHYETDVVDELIAERGPKFAAKVDTAVERREAARSENPDKVGLPESQSEDK